MFLFKRENAFSLSSKKLAIWFNALSSASFRIILLRDFRLRTSGGGIECFLVPRNSEYKFANMARSHIRIYHMLHFPVHRIPLTQHNALYVTSMMDASERECRVVGSFSGLSLPNLAGSLSMINPQLYTLSTTGASGQVAAGAMSSGVPAR